MAAEWYLVENNAQSGPHELEALLKHPALTPTTLVFGPGLSAWTAAKDVPAIADRMRAAQATGGAGMGVPPVPGGGGMAGSVAYAPSGGVKPRADIIDYEIFGSEMQYAEITLDPGETVLAEAGVMMYMQGGIKMDTHFGDPSAQNQGFFGKIASAGKRVLTGESLFVTTFQNQGGGRQTVAFAAPYPGKIIPLHLEKHQQEIICQKDSFICAAKGVQIGIAFQKKIGVGLFGGEGFIMQRLTGDGIALVHAGGSIMERVLQPGETLRIDTGCIVALERTVNYDIQFTGGIKNSLFGGEGLFLATLSGPGKIWLQSLPFSRLAGRIWANAPQGGGKGRDEGGILGQLGGLLGDSD